MVVIFYLFMFLITSSITLFILMQIDKVKKKKDKWIIDQVSLVDHAVFIHKEKFLHNNKYGYDLEYIRYLNERKLVLINKLK